MESADSDFMTRSHIRRPPRPLSALCAFMVYQPVPDCVNVCVRINHSSSRGDPEHEHVSRRGSRPPLRVPVVS